MISRKYISRREQDESQAAGPDPNRAAAVRGPLYRARTKSLPKAEF
jgi:hypothetical protein